MHPLPGSRCVASTRGGKGKARTRYEFGCKTSIATTNERCKGGQFVLGAMALPGNPYDGHSLAGQIEQVARLTKTSVARAYVDRGYRGHGINRDGLDITISHTRGIASPTIRREMRRRSGIEPVIGHLKEDGHLERNHLAAPEWPAFPRLSDAGRSRRHVAGACHGSVGRDPRLRRRRPPSIRKPSRRS